MKFYFVATYIRANPKVKALCSTFWNPQDDNIGMNLSGFGNCNTD